MYNLLKKYMYTKNKTKYLFIFVYFSLAIS